jgi:hypothetical protein
VSVVNPHDPEVAKKQIELLKAVELQVDHWSDLACAAPPQDVDTGATYGASISDPLAAA